MARKLKLKDSVQIKGKPIKLKTSIKLSESKELDYLRKYIKNGRR